MTPDETYELLRTLTSPVVAVTCRRGDKLNGMISDGAIRASIVPDVPRLGVFIHKFNYSHDLIMETGKFVMHVLHTGAGQVELVHQLGFVSGRDREKLQALAHRPGAKTGVPVLADCFCWFECVVSNIMDTGSSTFFMGEVVETGKGPGTEAMEPQWLRGHLTEEMKQTYLAKLTDAQDLARRMSREMRSTYMRK